MQLSTLFGDTTNCPNPFDFATGEYDVNGCCTQFNINADIYLNNFILATFGDGGCTGLEGNEAEVCNWMSDRANHGLLSDGYPYEFAGNVWDFLKVSIIVWCLEIHLFV